MNEDLKILPIKPLNTKKKTKRDIHPNLPDVYNGSLICIIGGVKQGKGNLWNNLIHRKTLFKDLFNSVYVISPSIDHDQTSRFTKQKYEETCYCIYNDKIIRDIEKKQSIKLETGDDSSYALILDDIIGCLNKYGEGKNSGAIHLSTRFRHLANRGIDPCMVLYSIQKYTELSPIVRSNMTDILISGQITSKKEIDAIRRDLGDFVGGENKFMELFNRVKKEGKYNFLYIKLDRGEPQVFLNFTDRLM